MESAQRILNYLVEDVEAFFTGKERKYALTEAMILSLDA